ncbi:MAG TPA: hypothetical protein DFS52_31430 [Myxococcales bacterium]|nr:hypothetical protein [Myxococcales bacterium]
MKTADKRTMRRFSDLRAQAIYDRENAIMELTEAVVRAMEAQNLTRAEVAKRLGKSKAAITQLLQGPNFRFGTAAELAVAVGLHFHARCEEDEEGFVFVGRDEERETSLETAVEAVSSITQGPWVLAETAYGLWGEQEEIE